MFVIVLTLCLAAILAIIITHKVKSKKDNSKETDITAFSINVINMETSVQENGND